MILKSHISKQLIENNLDSIILTNSAYEIEYANKIAIDLYGYSLDEFKGKHLNIFNVLGKEIPAESWDIIVKTGRWSGEVHRKRKDGSIFFASLSIFSILDDDGKLIGFAGNTKDITNTLKIQEALFEKQRQLVSIIDNTEDVIVSIDRNFRIVEFNLVLASFVKRGYNYDLKKGDYMLDYIDPTKHNHLISIYQRVFKGERVFDTETYNTNSKNSIHFESSYNPILDENHEVRGISIFSKNVTGRVNNEVELKKALGDKEILLSEIHHRLKNNLAIISSILHLQEFNISNEEALKALRESRMRIKSTALLHEMLYQNESIDKICLNEYLTKLFSDINNSMGNSKHKLTITGDDAALLLHNAVPAGLLFNELFTNAIKHGFNDKNEGEIIIKIKNNDSKTNFEIIESGNSFPEEIDFENSVSTGLTLVKTFAEQLKGEIRLQKKPTTNYFISLDLS